MIRHSIGDRVLCVDLVGHTIAGNINPAQIGLKEKQEYTVYDLAYCPGCGEQLISVGLASEANKHHCGVCNCLSSNPHPGVAFHLSKRFVKREELTQEEETSIEEEIKTILEESFSDGK